VNGNNISEYTIPEVNLELQEGKDDKETKKLLSLPKEPVNWRRVAVIRTVNVLGCVGFLGLGIYCSYAVTDYLAGGYQNMTLHHPGPNHTDSASSC
jgi:hypothetical protein